MKCRENEGFPKTYPLEVPPSSKNFSPLLSNSPLGNEESSGYYRFHKVGRKDRSGWPGLDLI